MSTQKFNALAKVVYTDSYVMLSEQWPDAVFALEEAYRQGVTVEELRTWCIREMGEDRTIRRRFEHVIKYLEMSGD